MFEDLYQEIILESSRSDLFRGDLSAVPTARHELVRNPLCGDTVDLWVDVQDGVVKDVRFAGQGCAISQASASLLAELIRGKEISALAGIVSDFQSLLDGECAEGQRKILGPLVALEGVRQFPIRRRCALLAFEALQRIVRSFDSPHQ